jgi:hypothetical protein
VNVRDLSPGGFVQAALGHGFVSTGGEAFTMLVYGKQAGEGPEWLYSYDGGNNYWTMGLESGSLKLYNSGSSGGPSYVSTDWSLYVATVAAGGAVPVFYMYNAATDTWEVDGAPGTDPVEQLGGPPSFVCLGVWNGSGSEHFDGLLAAAAYWRRALSKAEVHELVSLGNVLAWKDGLSPDLLLLMDEASPIDQTGHGGHVTNVDDTERKLVTLPFPLREGEEGGGEEEEEEEEEVTTAEVLVKSGGGLVKAKRYVKSGGVLVPA